MDPQATSVTRSSLFERISSWALILVTFLVPLALISTFASVPEVPKMSILALGTIVALASILLTRFRAKSIALVRDNALVVLGLIVVVMIISLLTNGLGMKAFFGMGIESGTIATVILLMLFGSCAAYFATDKRVMFYTYTALLYAAILTIVFHFLRIVIGPTFLSFSMFTTAASNFIGKWNDLGGFAGLLLVLSVVTLATLSLTRFMTIIFGLGFVTSLFLTIYVNFTFGWYVIAILMLALGWWIYRWRKHQPQAHRVKALILPAVTFIVAIVCIISSQQLSATLGKKFNIQQIEVRPSWQLTADIAYQTLREKPMFGSGPNTFNAQYLRFKPQTINTTVFWGAEFPQSVGYIPTFAITLGLVGAALWVIFLVIFARRGVRVYNELQQSPAAAGADGKSSLNFANYIALSSGFAAFFLWILAVGYVPSIALLVLLALFTGIFFGSYRNLTRTAAPYVFTWNKGSRKVVAGVGVAVLGLFLLAGLYLYGTSFVAAQQFQRGIAAVNDIEKAEKAFRRAVAIAPNETYYHALVELDILKMGRMVSTNKNPDAEFVKSIQDIITDALVNAQAALRIDPQNYRNFVEFGHIYEAAATLQAKDAYENAQSAYIEAINRNPSNPSLYLALAQFQAANRKFADAKRAIGAALQVKNNYSEAILLLSQIQVAEGSVKDAITSVAVASQLTPSNSSILFQLGLLKYNAQDYAGAAEALERAVAITPEYANARYFLGLSYYRLGKRAQATAEFEQIQKLNPDNAEVQLILSNLYAGKSPFTNAQPPVDSKPEQRKTLPVKDSLDKTSSSEVKSR